MLKFYAKMNLLNWIWVLFFISGSLAAQEVEKLQSFYVSSIGWHTAIVIPTSVFPDNLWTNEYNFSDALFLEIGWGEADYYPHDDFNIWYALKSVFWPTSSVLHINPINIPVEKYYYDTNVVRLDVTGKKIVKLREFLVKSFELDGTGKIIPIAEGKNHSSHFFKGNEKYYFPKNSNVWAARALKSSGFSLKPLPYQTTGCLLSKAEDFGEKVVEKR